MNACKCNWHCADDDNETNVTVLKQAGFRLQMDMASDVIG